MTCDKLLCITAEKGNVEMLKFLMDNGGDVTVTDAAGRSCLVQLNRENFHAVTQILVDRIIPLNQQDVYLRASLDQGQLVYVYEKLELPVLPQPVPAVKKCNTWLQVPADLSGHFEMLKSIRHMCETLCSIPGPKSAKPLL